ncbi:MAG: glutamate racemase [Anaerolineae bacterium]|jgi:glutamate racemase|nr:glutamate racemase [Anaerolineae bacterium]MBT4308977.1 glutamate racemase [Anaerolineae bacterium]MBT4459940.1 glutamate racemase [Anaerolineae bacterium]MBT4842418.1 glutamate racemase [Anaerolineae bacterium]MBT6060590.1 glutamate racemase [Anaerolineae bacterium]
MKKNSPIGIFDSGVGGLSVLRAIHKHLPNEDLFYFADQGHVPYGQRSLEEVRRFSIEITDFLLAKGAKIIIVACNTASAAALHHLREKFPDTPFVGMEPAVKPAAEQTNSGVVGVLATPATFQGKLYASVVERFASNVTVLQNTCDGLVEEIERGTLDGENTRQILDDALRDMLGRGLDTLVMGCTHYPFVIPLIEEIAGINVRVIDPAPAVAKQVEYRLESINAKSTGNAEGAIQLYTSGDAERLASLLPKLGFENFPVTGIERCFLSTTLL